MSASNQAQPGGYPVINKKNDQLRPQVHLTKKLNTKVERSGTQEAILEHANPHATATE